MKIADIHHYTLEEQKLTELVGSFQKKLLSSDWVRPKEVIDYLEGKGFEKIGAGAYSAVFWLPGSSSIIKLSMIEDKCWLSFADWAIKHNQTGNPILPKIYWVRKYEPSIRRNYEDELVPSGQTFFISMVEKLDNVFDNPNLLRKADPGILAYLAAKNHWFRVGNTWDVIADVLTKEGIMPSFDEKEPADVMSEEWYAWNRKRHDYIEAQTKVLQAYAKKNPAAKKFAHAVRKIESLSDECDLDLHNENVMFRKSTNSIVIIDPTAEF